MNTTIIDQLAAENARLSAELDRVASRALRLTAEAVELKAELARLQDLRENDPLRLMHVQDAIKASKFKSAMREDQCNAVERICYIWRARKEYDAKEVAAAENLKHAGLHHIACDMDWLEAFEHGCSEALWLVDKLTRCVDEDEVNAALDEFREPTVNAEDTWVHDESEAAK